MRIAPSIRVYVLMSILATGFAMIWGLSLLSNNYFFSGMDIATRNSMFAFVHQQDSETALTYKTIPESEDQTALRTITYSLVKAWTDVPTEFQQQYNANDIVLNKLYKHFEGTSFLAPPKTGYLLMKVLKNGDEHYVILHILHEHSEVNSLSDLNHVSIIALTALAVLTLFTLILLFVMRHVTLPAKQLKNWAKSLTNKELSQPVPDFHYSELNTLARLIRHSLSSVQESVEREQKFLGYASHELRTPIAVSRSNTELLKKLIEKDAPADKKLKVLDRILRANLTMTDLTETLLWLNRREGKALVSQACQLGILVEQLANDLKYLIADKPISIEIETDESIADLPESVCRIVISNLIRNAYQHTLAGKVTIKQVGSKFSILNQNESTELKAGVLDNQSLGFGLGLNLTERIVEQYQWQYETMDVVGGKDVSVLFEASNKE